MLYTCIGHPCTLSLNIWCHVTSKICIWESGLRKVGNLIALQRMLNSVLDKRDKSQNGSWDWTGKPPGYAKMTLCDRLWQKQTVGLKISFVHFSLELINNNFWLKCWKNYYSIFMGSRDINFIMQSYSEVQFWEKCMQSSLTQIDILAVHV